MVDISADKLAQCAFDVGLLDNQQLEMTWSELGTREVTADEFIAVATRRELLTKFQIDRLINSERFGYFYGDYKLLYMVGAGTFARVYRGVGRLDGKMVAVKVLRQRYGDDVQVRENFIREAEMVMQLRHPNVVPIYDVGSERNRPYMGMEFVKAVISAASLWPARNSPCWNPCVSCVMSRPGSSTASAKASHIVT